MPSSPRRVPHRDDGDDAIMNPKYKLLSDVRRSPTAVMTGKGASFGGGALSLDGTICSSHPNPLYNTATSGGGDNDGDSKNNTMRSSADGSALTSSARRVPQPPGPGAYVLPSMWTPTKGPVRWRPELFPALSASGRRQQNNTNNGSRAPSASSSRSNSPRTLRTPLSSSPNAAGHSGPFAYLPHSPNTKSYSMSSRWDGQVPKHAQLPGPGYYDGFKSDFSPKKEKGRCAFGMRTAPLKSPTGTVPGPGTYEVGMATPAEQLTMNGASYKTTAMAGKWVDPTPPKSPHALTYKVTAHFDQPLEGRGVATIKGRLDHPMDSRDVAHEPAKTDRPHDMSKRVKKRPVA